MEDKRNNEQSLPSASPNGNNQEGSVPAQHETLKAAISPAKLAANRRNAQESTGPRTAEGKAKSAANSYKHGFFAAGLFPTPEAAADKPSYLELVNGLGEHYKPVGYLENFWLEKIATEFLRSARVVRISEKVIAKEGGAVFFAFKGTDKILRYEGATSRRAKEAIAELERLQAKRKADSPEATDPPLDDTDGGIAPTHDHGTETPPNAPAPDCAPPNGEPLRLIRVQARAR